MLIKEMVKTKWTRQNKDHYESLGYAFTKINHPFEIKNTDLPQGSRIKVKIKCDICGKIYETCYRDYLHNHSENFGDTCFSCCSIKRKSTCMKKYGVSNPSQVDEFKEKRKQTHLEKFGVENAFQSEMIKEKIKETCLGKYGVEYVAQNKEIQEKIKNTCLEKYGSVAPAQSFLVQEKIRQTCLEKYGVESTLELDWVREKGRKTLYEQGKVPTSRPERKMCEILKDMYGSKNCFPSYTYSRLSLDCLVKIDGTEIDVEYDGWYWHKNKQKEDNKRNRFLISKGIKVLRVKANYEVPTQEQLKEAIDYLVKGNHDYAEIKLDI